MSHLTSPGAPWQPDALHSASLNPCESSPSVGFLSPFAVASSFGCKAGWSSRREGRAASGPSELRMIREEEAPVFVVLGGPQQFEKNPNASGIMGLGEL